MTDQIISKKNIIKQLLINQMAFESPNQNKKVPKEAQENSNIIYSNNSNATLANKKNDYDDSDEENKNNAIEDEYLNEYSDDNDDDNDQYNDVDREEEEDEDENENDDDEGEYGENDDDDDEDESDEYNGYNFGQGEDASFNYENKIDSSKSSNQSNEKNKKTEDYQVLFNDIIQVNCNSIVAEMHVKKFGSGGKGKCIKVLVNKQQVNENETNPNNESESIQKEEKWLTPIEFERYCGKENCRDWKRTIKIGGQPLLTAFNSKILVCHAVSCSCSVCQNDTSVVGPIRPFIRYRRRKKDEILAENAYKKFLRLKPPTLFKKPSNASKKSSNKLYLNDQNQTGMPLKKNKFNDEAFSKNILENIKLKNDIKDIEKEMEISNEEFWSPLEQMAIQLVNQTINLRKMIEKAKRESQINRLKLIKEVVLLNEQNKIDKKCTKKRKLSLSQENK